MSARGRKINGQGRSKGDAHHVRVYGWLIKSEVWRSLSGNAAKLYVTMSSLYYGDNNGELYMSHRKAAEWLDVSENTAAKAINELQEKGFIRPLVKGSFSRKQRHATQWVLTEHDFRGRKATKDFMLWKKEKNADSQAAANCIKNQGSKKELPPILNQIASDIEADLCERYMETPSNVDAQISYHEGRRKDYA